MIRTPTLHSLDSSAFVDNLAAIPCGYFCEIGLNIVRFVLPSLRSSFPTGTISSFSNIFAKFVLSAHGW